MNFEDLHELLKIFKVFRRFWGFEGVEGAAFSLKPFDLIFVKLCSLADLQINFSDRQTDRETFANLKLLSELKIFYMNFNTTLEIG